MQLTSAFDLESTTAAFVDTLREARDLASRIPEIERFVVAFNAGVDAVEAPETSQRSYHPDLAPQGTILPAAQALLDACQHAWVFGGMGSWSDIGVEGPRSEEFLALSDRLYMSLIQAALAATNSDVIGP